MDNIKVKLEHNEEFYIENGEVGIDISKSTRKVSSDGESLFNIHQVKN